MLRISVKTRSVNDLLVVLFVVLLLMSLLVVGLLLVSLLMVSMFVVSSFVVFVDSLMVSISFFSFLLNTVELKILKHIFKTFTIFRFLLTYCFCCCP